MALATSEICGLEAMRWTKALPPPQRPWRDARTAGRHDAGCTRRRRVLARARQTGLETLEGAFALGGMWMRLREETA